MRRKGKSEYTAASVLYQALFAVSNEGIFIVGLYGIAGGNILQSGGAASVCMEHGPKKCDVSIIQETDLQDAVVKAI